MGLNSAFKLIGDLPRKLPRYEVSTRLPAFAIGHDHDHCVAAQAVLRRLLRVQTRCGPWVDSAEPTGPMANLWRGHALAPAHDRTVTRVPGWSGKSGPDQQRNSDCCWTEASTKRQSQREDADLEKSEQRFGRVDVKPETASMAHTVREHVRDAPAARALTKKRAMRGTEASASECALAQSDRGRSVGRSEAVPEGALCGRRRARTSAENMSISPPERARDRASGITGVGASPSRASQPLHRVALWPTAPTQITPADATVAWSQLLDHQDELASTELRTLFAEDPPGPNDSRWSLVI
ncbi:hypothetical protein GQR58_029728 [Nymphon striatum]|nr:hypothetical protein GQR58_029728 [Nymphon striatum]